MQRIKKSLALLLIAVLVVSLLPLGVMPAQAANGTHDGSVWYYGYFWAESGYSYTWNGKTIHPDHGQMHRVKVDGTSYVAYCLDPLTDSSGGSGYAGTDTAIDGDWSKGLSYTPTAWQQRAIGLALLYGYPNTLTSDSTKERIGMEVATQIVIWEIVTGMRSPEPPYRCTNTVMLDAYGPDDLEITGGYFNGRISTVRDAYAKIDQKMAEHDVIPSFMGVDRDGAHAITLYPAADGTYTATVKDENGVLGQCQLPTVDGVRFAVNGNQLTVTATAPLDGLVIEGRKNVPNLAKQVFTIYTRSGDQTLITPGTVPTETMPIYMKLNTLAPGSIKLTKLDGKTGEKLAGAQFRLDKQANTDSPVTEADYQDFPGGEPALRVTDSSGTALWEGLKPGTYYLKEITPPTGYALSVEATQVTVVSGQTTPVSWENERLPAGAIRLTKLDGKTGEKLAGAQFRLDKQADTDSPVTEADYQDYPGGEPALRVTDSSGTALWEGLKPGTYFLKEITPPTGYALSVEATQVTVVSGQTTPVTWENEHLPTGSIKLTKVSATTGDRLAGAIFALYKQPSCADGTWLTASDYVHGKVPETDKGYRSQAYSASRLTGEDGEVTWTDLPPGTYYLKELQAPPGYVPSQEVTPVEVKPEGETTISRDNEEDSGYLHIVKTTTDGGSVEGWVFRVRDEAGAELPGSPFTTDSEGKIVTQVAPGTYTVEECIPPESLYICISENPQSVTVEPGKTGVVQFINQIQPTSITVHKEDPSGQPLQGATFLLEWSEDGVLWQPVFATFGVTTLPDGTQVAVDALVRPGGCASLGLDDGRLTSGADGLVCFEQLYPGLYYRLTEVAAPEGCQLLTEPAFRGILPGQTGDLVLRAVNAPVFELPQTGSTALRLTPIAAAMFALAGVLLLTRKKKER